MTRLGWADTEEQAQRRRLSTICQEQGPAVGAEAGVGVEVEVEVAEAEFAAEQPRRVPLNRNHRHSCLLRLGCKHRQPAEKNAAREPG